MIQVYEADKFISNALISDSSSQDHDQQVGIDAGSWDENFEFPRLPSPTPMSKVIPEGNFAVINKLEDLTVDPSVLREKETTIDISAKTVDAMDASPALITVKEGSENVTLPLRFLVPQPTIGI